MKRHLRTYWAIAKKEVFHITRDTRTLLILFGMPVALVLIFGYTITNEFRGASIGIVDQSDDQLSQLFIEHVGASGHFEIVDVVQSIKELEGHFERGSIKMGIVIGRSFEMHFYSGSPASVQLIMDATEPNYAATLHSYAQQMIGSFNKRYLQTERGMPISVSMRMFYNPTLSSAYNFVPGVVALILMLICAMMTSLTIAREKETGTMDLLLISPVPPILIILGKVTPYVVLSFADALIVFGMGYFIFGVPVVGSLPLLLILCVIYLLVALTLGVLISTRAPSQQVAMVLSMFVLLLPTMLLSGFIFPIPSMPDVLQYISHIIPARYFIQIEKAIMLKGVGLDVVWQPAVILLVMLFVFLMAARKNFKVVYK